MTQLTRYRPTNIGNWDVCPKLFRYRMAGWRKRNLTKSDLKPVMGIAVAHGMDYWHKTNLPVREAVAAAKELYMQELQHLTNHGCELPSGWSAGPITYISMCIEQAIKAAPLAKWTELNTEVFVEGVEGARVDVIGKDDFGVWSIADYKATFPYKPLSDYEVDMRFSSYLYGHQAGLYPACKFTVNGQEVVPSRFYIILLEPGQPVRWRYREISQREREQWLRNAKIKMKRMTEDEAADINDLHFNEHHKDPFGRPCEFFEGCVEREGATETWGDLYVQVPSSEHLRTSIETDTLTDASTGVRWVRS